MYFKQFLSGHYWFELNPGYVTTRTLFYLGIIFLITFGIGLFCYLGRGYIRRKNKFYTGITKKISNLGTVMGIIGLVYSFFIYERVYLLSARFWFIVWLLGVLAWIIYLIYFAKKKMPKEKDTIIAQSTFEKYLPREPKRKK